MKKLTKQNKTILQSKMTVLTQSSCTLLFQKHTLNCLREDTRKKSNKTRTVHTLADLAFGNFY